MDWLFPFLEVCAPRHTGPVVGVPSSLPSAAASRGSKAESPSLCSLGDSNEPNKPWPLFSQRFPRHLPARCLELASCSADLLLIATTRQQFPARSAAGASCYTSFFLPQTGVSYPAGAAFICPHLYAQQLKESRVCVFVSSLGNTQS